MNTKHQPKILKPGEGESLKALGSEITFLGKADQAWSIMHMSAPTRVGPPPHEHDFDEAYYVLSGSFRFSIAGEESELAAGSFIHIPGGVVHGFRGTSEAPAQLLIFQAPGDAGDFFRDVAREVTQIPADLPLVPEIGARHGIRFPPSPCHTPNS